MGKKSRCLLWFTLLFLICTNWKISKEYDEVQKMAVNKEFENLPLVLPRRPSKLSLNRASLIVKSTPSWFSCPSSNSPTAIWTMPAASIDYIRGAVVLGMSIKSFWNVTRYGPLPDLRVMVIHPDPVPASWWPTLEKAGWEICHFPRIPPPKEREDQPIKDCYSKLHLWNMTDYKKLLFLDSDILIKKDNGSIMEKAERLMDPASTEPGLRIVGALDIWGKKSFNGGVFLIRPDWEEYMWLMNVYTMGKVPLRMQHNADQDVLNYLYSKEEETMSLDWADAVVINTHGRETWHKNKDNFTIIHYAGKWKPWKMDCTFKECEEWREVEKKMLSSNN